MDDAQKPSRQQVIDFLQTQMAVVVSTLSEDQTIDSAFVYGMFNQDADFYFITNTFSKKYRNIQSNGILSYAFAEEDNLIAIQGKGKAEIVHDLGESKRIYDLLLQVLRHRLEHWPPPFAKMEESNLAIVKVSTQWLRWGDFSHLGTQPLDQFFVDVIP